MGCSAMRGRGMGETASPAVNDADFHQQLHNRELPESAASTGDENFHRVWTFVRFRCVFA